MFNRHDLKRNACQLFGAQAKCGYDWWWHSFTGRSASSGKEKSFYIEYFLCNPASGEGEPVLGQSEVNREDKKKPSYLMVNAGAWGEDHAQLHRFFGWDEIKVDFGTPYSIKADDCYACETHISGSIQVDETINGLHPEWMSDAGKMVWNLSVNKIIPFNVGYGASSLMRKLQLFEMFWHAEGMKTEYEGEVIYNGEIYDVIPETCYGYADKNWGKNFTTPWLWLSSNDLVSEISGERLTDSVFDIGGGRPKIGALSLKGKLLSAFFYEGKEFEFNFSKFWTFTRTKFSCEEDDEWINWHVEQKTWLNRMVTDVKCAKKTMLLINYEAPDGTKRHTRLWNGGTGTGTVSLYRNGKLIDRIRAEHIGCEYGEYDATGPYHISK